MAWAEFVGELRFLNTRLLSCPTRYTNVRIRTPDRMRWWISKEVPSWSRVHRHVIEWRLEDTDRTRSLRPLPFCPTVLRTSRLKRLTRGDLRVPSLLTVGALTSRCWPLEPTTNRRKESKNLKKWVYQTHRSKRPTPVDSVDVHQPTEYETLLHWSTLLLPSIGNNRSDNKGRYTM